MDRKDWLRSPRSAPVTFAKILTRATLALECASVVLIGDKGFERLTLEHEASPCNRPVCRGIPNAVGERLTAGSRPNWGGPSGALQCTVARSA